MRYGFVVLFLLFLSLVFTGCGAKAVGQVNVEEALSLPEKHYPVGFDPYGKRILLAVLGNEGAKLEFYSIKNKEIEIAVEPAINGKSIKNAVTDGKYIAWVEATDGNRMWSDDWRIYVKNLKSGEIKKLVRADLQKKEFQRVNLVLNPNCQLMTANLSGLCTNLMGGMNLAL